MTYIEEYPEEKQFEVEYNGHTYTVKRTKRTVEGDETTIVIRHVITRSVYAEEFQKVRNIVENHLKKVHNDKTK